MESWYQSGEPLAIRHHSPRGILPRLTSNSSTTPSCSYTTESFFKNVTTECQPFIDALQACPASSVPIKLRLEAARNAARCLDVHWRQSWYGTKFQGNPSDDYLGGSHGPPSIEKSSNCTYPDFLPILNTTCTFDLNAFDHTCSTSFEGPGRQSDAYLKCQSAAASQYVRCTLQKPAEDVASCVADNAVKVDWLYQIQSYAGASTCPEANQILIVLGVGLFVQLLQTLFRVLCFPRVRRKVRSGARSFKEKRGTAGGQDESTTQEPPPAYLVYGPQDSKAFELQPSAIYGYPPQQPFNSQYVGYPQEIGPYQPQPAMAPCAPGFQVPLTRDVSGNEGLGNAHNYDTDLNPWPHPWTVEDTYTLKATRLLQSVGREVLTAYLTVLVLDHYGYTTDNSFVEELSFYLIRPRNAPFFGLLGIFKPWSQQGLAELVVDFVLSFFAGTAVASKYWSLTRQAPANPAAPYHDQLYPLAAGSVMTFMPDFVLFAVTFIVALYRVARTAGEDDGRRQRGDDENCYACCCAAAMLWAWWMSKLAAFIAILPLVAVVEIFATIIMAIRHKRRVKKGRIDGAWEVWERKRSRWEAPLTTSRMRFRVLYYFMVLFSFITNIGNWIFWASYLKVEGEMYCPASVSGVLAMWVCVPLGIDLLFFVYRWWTQDVGYSGGTPVDVDGTPVA